MSGGGGPDLVRFRASLERTPGAVRALLVELSDEDAQWRPDPSRWSILEIVNHLADEDADDFVPRLERTLRDTREAWDPIDPEAAARERSYNERELGASIDRFEAVRRSSLNWLATIDESTDWGAAHPHPVFGPLAAGQLLVSWVAHDHLHVRQLAKRLFQLTERDSGGYSTRYAGEWGA